MEVIKEKVSNWLGYFKDHINYFQIVNQEKNVIYFTKFTLEPKEFYEIHNFVLTLKLNIFNALIEVFKYCVNSFIIFEDKNLSEREKVMVIYSACFLNYYKKFLYDINHTFEEFYDDDFMSLIKTTFKFEVNNLQLFKVFCLTFFEKMKEEIKNLNYEKNIKPLKHTYNPKITQNNINVLNLLFGTNSNDNNNSININNNLNTINQINNEEGGIRQQAITYLVSAKERMVDLVFEMKYRGMFPNMCLNEINKMNVTLNQLGNISAQELHNLNTPPNFKKDETFNNSFFQNDISMYDDKTSTNSNESMNRSSINFNESMNKTGSSLSESMNTIMTESNNNINFINNNVNTNSFNNINMSNMYSNNINRFNIYNQNTINDNNNNNINKINIINTNVTNPNNINSININNNNMNKNNINNINLSNNSAFKPNQNINIKPNNSTENNNMYSQRLMSELIKDKVDDKTLEIIKNVAKKIDEQFLDHLLNYSKKPIRIMKYFSCYIAEFTPEMLQNIEPNNKEILKNFCIRFIILAKELYNTTMELFCSIYDLSYNKVERFVDLARNCGIQFKYAQGLYKLFKDYSIILLEKGSFNDLKKTVDKFVEKEKVNWDKVVNQFSDKFSSYFQD
jgi:hypothetical protein